MATLKETSNEESDRLLNDGSVRCDWEAYL